MRDSLGVSLRIRWISVAVLASAGLLGGGAAVAEPVLGLPGSLSALGAPWLVCAFAAGTLARRRWIAAATGALLLGSATCVYYGAQLYGHGFESLGYATTMAIAWGAIAGVAGAAMAAAGSIWRDEPGRAAAWLGALPAAALAGEALLLSGTWRGIGAAAALAAELAAAGCLVVALNWRRMPLLRSVAATVALAAAFAVAEAQVRDYMHAAGWHGA
jgi:hypothetical protein